MINQLNIHNYPNIRRFLNQKKFTIIIEGNIASGKSTLINELKKLQSLHDSTLHEPLKKWQNVYGLNLLGCMYTNPHKWSFTFQNYATLTMLQNHLHPARNKIMERSLWSVENVFSKAHQIRGTIVPL